MNKTYLMTAFVALAFVTAMASVPVGADGPREVEETYVSFGDLSADHEGGYEEFQCDGQLALYLTDVPGCEFGDEHTVGGFGYIILGFQSVEAGNVGPVPLTGTVQALLTHDGGEVDFRCTWDAGTFQGCQIFSLSFPSVGDTFTFSCQSMEGAIGNWGECYVGHE